MQIINDNTLKVNTNDKQPYLAIQLGTLFSPEQGAVMPKDYIEKNGVEYFKQHPVGTGPFKFVRHISGDMIQYQALDSHWRKVPAFRNLTLILMPEETTRIASLKTGAIDATDVSLESANELEKAGFKTPTLNYNSALVMLSGAYTPQGSKLPTADIRVRQALSLAINRDELINSFFYGKARPALPAFTMEASQNVDVAYWTKYAADNLNTYDQAKARQLLKDAGYPNGFSFKFWTCTISGSPYLPRMAEVIQGYWKQIGVTAEIVSTDWGTYQGLRKKPELIGQASTYRYPVTAMLPKDLSVAYQSTGTFALLGTTNPDIDKLINDSYTEMDSNKRTEMLAKVIKAGSDTYTALALASAPVVCALGPKVDINFPIPTWAVGLGVDIATHRK
jgi:peptide/nickel transport system substrate-binding protein